MSHGTIRRGALAILLSTFTCAAGAAAPGVLVLKDFEGKLSYDAKSRIIKDAKGNFYNNFYNGPSSTIEGALVTVPGAKGEKTLWVKWNNNDYAGCGFSLPAPVFTGDYTGFRFMVKGTETYRKYKFILGDAGNESWIAVVEDDGSDWKTVTIPLTDFQRRTDYQPSNSDSNNTLDFPITNFNLEVVDTGELELWLDQIEIVR